MKSVSVFLIVIALLVGMVGCGGESYALVISSTEGGSVTDPGEGIFIYDEGTVVNLIAEPEEGYYFANWTGDVSTIVDVNATATNITMNGSYNVTANLELIASGPPVISSLTADADWTLPGGNIQVMCDALDPDGNELSYEWSTDGGSISGTGTTINWTAPQEIGICSITVVVSDGHGSSDTRTLFVGVATEEPPTIEDLIVTADHCYLRAYSWGYKVGREEQYHIECILSGNSTEVSYQWSCEDGTISGEGSMITWTAPDYYVESLVVTVIVSNIVSGDVVLQVVSCKACTFGC